MESKIGGEKVIHCDHKFAPKEEEEAVKNEDLEIVIDYTPPRKKSPIHNWYI